MALPREVVEKPVRMIDVGPRPWYVRLRIWWHQKLKHDVDGLYLASIERYFVWCQSCQVRLDYVDKKQVRHVR